VLKVVERTNLATGVRAEKVIQAQISVLLGIREHRQAFVVINQKHTIIYDRIRYDMQAFNVHSKADS